MLSSRYQTIVLIAAVLVIAALAPILSSSSGADPATLDAKTMEAWWSDLEMGETAATRALLKLSDRPKDTVAFLKQKMKPLTISSAQVKALLLKLGNSNESVWKPAFEELEYFDPRLAIDLETLIDRYTESPVRPRLVEILSGRAAGSLLERQIQLSKVVNGFNFTGKTALSGSAWWAEHRVDRLNDDRWGTTKKKWTRAVRAIVLLEHIGNPDAVAILKDLATGHPDAHPTKVAKEALERIAGTDKAGRAVRVGT